MKMRNQVMLKHNPGEKSLKAPFTIYLDLECLLKKVQSSQNNPEKSYTEKKLDMSLLVGHYIQNVHLRKKENKLNYYRGIDCIIKLCEKLKEEAMEIIICEKKRNGTINP